MAQVEEWYAVWWNHIYGDIGSAKEAAYIYVHEPTAQVADNQDAAGNNILIPTMLMLHDTAYWLRSACW